MPKRSNPFQQVVALLHKQCIGASVVESKFMFDSGTKRQTEVDVVIEAIVEGDLLVTSIECTDTRRRATVEWIDQMYGKHATLATNKLVLISHLGFTKNAQKKADFWGITLLALKETATADWQAIIGKISALESVQSTYQAFIVVDSEDKLNVLSPPRDLTLHGQTTGKFAVLGDLLDKIMAMPELGNVIMDHMSEAINTSSPFTAELTFPELMEFKGPQGDTLTTHLLRITINAEHQLHHISLTQGTLNGTAVAFGEVVNKSSNTRVAIVDGLGALPIVEVIKLQSGEWKALVNATAKTPDVIINRVTKP